MYVETTINIDRKNLRIITYLAEQKGVSRSCIIKGLLKGLLATYTFGNTFGKRVRYQKTSEEHDWHRFHITFTYAEYELFKDIPKVCKFSLAFFLVLAIDRVLKNNDSSRYVNPINTDNHRYTCYTFISETIDDIPSWRIYWGLPSTIP